MGLGDCWLTIYWIIVIICKSSIIIIIFHHKLVEKNDYFWLINHFFPVKLIDYYKEIYNLSVDYPALVINGMCEIQCTLK